MNIARTKTVVALEIPTVDNVTEAQQVSAAIKAGEVTTKKSRDAANGLLEAFFVTELRATPKARGALRARISELQAQFPKDSRLARALHRVKAFRGKNPAWKNVNFSA